MKKARLFYWKAAFFYYRQGKQRTKLPVAMQTLMIWGKKGLAP